VSATVTEAVSASDLVAAVRRQQAPRPASPPQVGASPIRGASVVSAHPGAGATTVAVALADALDAIGRPGTLLDLAPSPDAFAAAECEVDSRVPGWRAGRRGQTQVLRRRTHEADAPKFSSDLVVVDGRMESLKSRVLVCRATLPSVRRADADLPHGAVLAVVGCSRWPKVVAASLGPSLQHAMNDGRIVFVPQDPDLELYGIDAEPMPSSARAAGRHVIELLWPDLAGPSSPHRWRGRRR
jgi:hypothetical protein